MTPTTSDPDIEVKLRLRALARWENEGGRVLPGKMRQRHRRWEGETPEDTEAPPARPKDV